MDTSRRTRRLGILCLIGLLVMITTVPPQTGYTARLATEEAPTKKTAPRGTAQGGGRDGKGATERTISFNLRNADIVQVINLISELTGKSFLVDDKVRGKVTIIAPTEVTLEEAYQIFLSVLEIQGFTIVPQGPIIKIIPSRDVKDNPIPTATNTQHPFSPTTESFVTQLVPLQYADANDIRGLLTPLVSKESSLLAYAPTNSLIVTDTVANINRLLKIITALDVEAPSAIFRVVMLKFAQAEQIANALRSAVEGLGGAGGPDTGTGAPPGAEAAPPPPSGQPATRGRRPAQASAGQRAQRGPRIVPDARTNSLVLIATRADMSTLEDLIAKLDVRTPEGRGQIHVYYLQYANAEELAQVLTAQAGEITRTLTPTTTPSTGPSTPPGGLPPTTPGGGLPPTTSTLGTQTTRRQGVVGGTTPLGISIVADKPTNSLVITAPPEAYVLIKEVIQKLDVRRSQVLVETLIAEVTLNKAQNLGVEWRAINSPDGTQVFASSTGSGQTGLLNSTLSPIGGAGTGTGTGIGTTSALAGLTSLASQGFLIGLLRTLTITPDPSNPNSTVQILNIPLLLRAFQGDTDVNILSTPNLLTTDNEEAEIIIGEERPFLRQAQDTPIGGVATSTSTIRTFDFKDTGITLRITPQISQGKTVRLKLLQEVKAFVSESEVGAVTTTKRSAKTTVIVDDSQTIVIGGLISNDNNEAKTSVPCLGNIPIFGWAFKQTSILKRKTNLLIFLTPHIITSPEDIDRVTTHEIQRREQAPAIEERLRQGQPQDNLELLLN
jgi:general secretion pathway protein D